MIKPPESILLYYRPAFFCNFAYQAKPRRDGQANTPPPIAPDEDVDNFVERQPGHDHGRRRADGGARPRHPRPPHPLPAAPPRAGSARNDGPELRPTITLWTRHPAELDYDPAGAFSINLFYTPEQVALGNICPHEVVADDHTHNNGYTTVGPAFPHAYGAGGIYVCETKLHEAIRRDKETLEAHHYPADPHRGPLVDDTVLVAFEANPADEPRRLFVPRRYHGFFGQQMTPAGNDDAESNSGTVWVVWHPGTWRSKEQVVCDGTQWRPPRKLWIPDLVRPRPEEFPLDHPAPPDGTGNVGDPVFLEQEYALYTAALEVPKQPSGSGEDSSVVALASIPNRAAADRLLGLDERGAGLEALAVAQPGAAPSPAASDEERHNLSVISSYAPGEISRIKRNFMSVGKNFLSVEEGETLVDALSAYVGRLRARKLRWSDPQPPFENLDLIGHSRSRDHILKIGELALTSVVAREQFTQLVDRDILDLLGIKAIRLLGCRTASYPRGERVVRAIYEATELEVYATRTDLFAVHYDGDGLRTDAEVLLADHDVIMKSGAGDLPPSDDYLPDPPDDDPNDPEDSDALMPAPQPPDRFSLAALSDANASKMSAGTYLWWAWRPDEFARLVELVYADWGEEDNPLKRAEYEVLLAVSTTVRDTSDVRSFDLFLKGDQPRLRVNRGGRSYAFCFRPTAEPLCCALNRIGICIAALDHAQSLGCRKGAAQAKRE
jgi:hypothetical protein